MAQTCSLRGAGYVRLCGAAIRGTVTRPFYRHDVIEQFEAVGIGSLTVVLLTGFFTGAVLALNSGMTLDRSAPASSSAGSSARRWSRSSARC